MTVTARLDPAGCVSLPIDRAMNTFAASAACRQFLEVDTEAEAKARMHLSSVELPLSGGDEHSIDELEDRVRPLMQFWHEDNSLQLRRDATQGWVTSGVLIVLFEQDDDETTQPSVFNRERAFANMVGSIILEAMGVQEQYDKLSIEKVRMELPPFRPAEAEESGRGAYWGCAWRIEFGVL